MENVDVKTNILAVREQIKEACRKSGRNENDVALCAVSKFHPVDSVIQALDADQLVFGENRVQEAYSKFNEIKAAGRNFDLHIIGSLQLNKVKKAVEIASTIQSVDRLDLIEEIEKHAARLNDGAGKIINIYFEVHTGEESKSGYSDMNQLEKDVELIAQGKYPHVKPVGFMTMAPFTQDQSLVHKSFATLRELSQHLNRQFPQLGMCQLSMGMSGDYKIAIEEGSTMVRVGTAIFGERDYSK